MENIDEKINRVTVKIHESLRDNGITEKYKTLFIACLLVALKNKKFCKNYEEIKEFDPLFKLCKDAVLEQLNGKYTEGIKIYSIITDFEEVTRNKKLRNTPLDKTNSLRWYIDQLKDNVCSLQVEDKDVVGIMYHQFIRYSSGDRNSLGIVLTPTHIAEFMAELIDIKKNDNVLDTCCGTGTFLAAASDKAKNGKIYGIEMDADRHSLSVLSVAAQGRNNVTIMEQDCFHLSYSNLGINKALINPPYSQKEHNELDFVMQTLTFMEKGGLLACICPLSCAIGSKSIYNKVREELLKKHTLELVLTMPDDLFYGCGASTFTCIMVWRAHIPNNDHNTFFMRCKDDGFEKKRKFGRLDTNGKWDKIKNKWLSMCRARDVDDSMSCERHVTAQDEWLCESYLRMDVTQLTDDDFQQTINDYVSFLVKEGIVYEY